MAKLDLKKEMKHLYSPSSKQAEIVQVPAMNYLLIDGEGNPNTSPQFQDAVQAIYGISYTIKFAIKKRPDGVDYAVMPLEGLWWTEDMAQFSVQDKQSWAWRLLIMQPNLVTEADVNDATLQQKRKGKDSPALKQVRFECFEEGLCAQIMHIGPYEAEEPTVRKLHEFLAEQGYKLSGKHHEIYLGDPQRTAPDKLRTILRQPVCR